MKESRGQKKTIDYLVSQGAWTVKVIAANKTGVPDILACLPMTKDEILALDQEVIGVFVAIEQKAEDSRERNDRSEALQKRNISLIKKAGGLSGIAKTVRNVKRILGKL